MGAGASAAAATPSWELPSEFAQMTDAERFQLSERHKSLVSEGATSADAMRSQVGEVQAWRQGLEQEVVSLIADLRRRPAREACVQRLKDKIGHMHGKEYTDPLQPGVVKVTKEGRAAIDDAIAYMLSISPAPGDLCRPDLDVQCASALHLAAEDHCCDIGNSGAVSHAGRDGSAPADRMNRYALWKGGCSECIWYGNLSRHQQSLKQLAETIIDDLIIDDGVSSRGHRLTVMNEIYNWTGASVRNHSIFGHVVVIDFASQLLTDPTRSEALKRREGQGPDTYPPIDLTSDHTNGSKTQWKVLGKCQACHRPIEGGRVVEKAICREGSGKEQVATEEKMKWHEACFHCQHCDISLKGLPYREVSEILRGTDKVSSQLTCIGCWDLHHAPLCESCGNRIVGGKSVKWRNKTYDKACYETERGKQQAQELGSTAALVAASLSRASISPTVAEKSIDGSSIKSSMATQKTTRAKQKEKIAANKIDTATSNKMTLGLAHQSLQSNIQNYDDIK